jgi:hypothetical protein
VKPSVWFAVCERKPFVWLLSVRENLLFGLLSVRKLLFGWLFVQKLLFGWLFGDF